MFSPRLALPDQKSRSRFPPVVMPASWSRWRLTCPTDPGSNTIIRGSPPVSQGRETYGNFRVLGTCPTPTQGAANITGLYTAQYGVPPVGTKVFLQVNQFVNGWADLPVSFWAIVPATTA
jgi:hypothetical protein